MWKRAQHPWVVSLLLSAFVYQAGACPCGCWEHSLWHLVVDGIANPLTSLHHDDAPSPVHRSSQDHDHDHGHDHGDGDCQIVMRAPMNRPGVRSEIQDHENRWTSRPDFSAALYACHRTGRLWEYARHESAQRTGPGGLLAATSTMRNTSLLQVFLL